MKYALDIPATRNGVAFVIPAVINSIPEKVADLLMRIVRYLNNTAPVSDNFHIDENDARAALAETVLQ